MIYNIGPGNNCRKQGGPCGEGEGIRGMIFHGRCCEGLTCRKTHRYRAGRCRRQGNLGMCMSTEYFSLTIMT